MRNALTRPLFVALWIALAHLGVAAEAGQALTWGKFLHYLPSGQFTTNLLVAPTGLSNVIALASGLQHVSALRSDGRVTGLGEWEWGLTNVPADLTNALAISAGDYHTLAVTRLRQVRAWGASFNNQCVVPAAATNVVAVAAGGFHSLALRGDGQLLAWGDNRYGQCDIPAALTNAVALAAGTWHSLALLADGRVLAWGSASAGQLNIPVNLTNAVALAARASYTLALKADGSLVGWGQNEGGALNPPPTLMQVLAISAGDRHALAAERNGNVFAWGTNTTSQTNVPASATNATALSAGSLHSAVALGCVPPGAAPAQPGWVVRANQRAILVAGVPGSQPMSYQWRRDGTLLAGATRSLLALNRAQPGDAGTYSVIASNLAGQVTNVVVHLGVFVPEVTTARFRFRDDSTLGNWKGAYGTRASLIFGHATNIPTGNLTLTAGQFYAFQTNTSDARALERVDSAFPTNRYAGFVFGTDFVELQCAFPRQETNQLALYLMEPGGGRAQAVELFDPANGDRLDRYDLSSLTNGSYLVWDVAGPLRVRISRLAGSNVLLSGVFVGRATGQAPAVRAEPFSQTVPAGARALLAVGTAGEPALGFQWTRNGLPLSDSAALSGARTPVLTLNAVTASEVGSYRVVVTNVHGAVTSGAATVALVDSGQAPLIVSAPQSVSTAVGTSATFTVTATGTAPLAYQWRYYGATVAGGTGSTLTLANVQPSQAGNYSVVVTNSYGSVTSAVATLTVTNSGVAPAITSQPTSRTNAVGSLAKFTVTASGTALLAYQWRHNGAAVAGGTGTTLALLAVQLSQSGSYSVVITNSYGAVTSAIVTLAVTNPGVAPSITDQPASVTNSLGSATAFTVVASGTAPLTYQWCFNGADIFGGTQSTLSLTNVQLSQVGNYSVVVTNGFGAVTSALATLTITNSGVAPAITSQPVSRTNKVGTTARFTVIATGSGPLTYQWRFKGAELADATGSTLVLNAVQAVHVGAYQAVVANHYGAVTSVVAMLALYPGIARPAEDSELIDQHNGCFLSAALEPAPWGIRIRCTGVPGRTYRIQTAAALAGPWANASTNLASATGAFEWLDATAPTAPRRFYRTVLP